MADTTIIAIAGIAGTAGTGIGSTFFAGWLEGKREARRFRNERLTRDFDELRNLLDSCAEAATAYGDALDELEGRFMFIQSLDADFYIQQIGALGKTKKAAHALNRRLVIRMGRVHNVVHAFGNCLRLLDEASAFVGTKISEHTMKKPNKFEEWLTGYDARMKQRGEAHENFLDAATALVGSPVEPLLPA